jgi:hypothetical protein
MWQQRTTKYGTNSFKYVAAEHNKVQYKLIQVCGSREQQSRRRISELSVGQYIIKQNISKFKYFTRKKLSKKK